MSAFNTYIPENLSSSSLTVALSPLILVLLIQMHLCPEFQFQKLHPLLSPITSSPLLPPLFQYSHSEKDLTTIFILKPLNYASDSSLLSFKWQDLSDLLVFPCHTLLLG